MTPTNKQPSNDNNNEPTKTDGGKNLKVGFSIEDSLWADFCIMVEEHHVPKGCCKTPGDLIRKLIRFVLFSQTQLDGLKKYGPEDETGKNPYSDL